MKSKRFIVLYFIVAFFLVIAWAKENDSTKPTVIRDGHKQALAIVNPQVILPQYKTADLLQEDLGGSIVDLISSNISTSDLFWSFSILNEGGTYFLWLNTSMEVTAPSPSVRPSVEQRFESTDGLIWRNRTDTDLVKNQPFKFTAGLRGIFNNGDTYQGWEQYYYEWSSGWGFALRYATSNNGINWTVLNDPALIGTRYFSIITDGVTYHMWGHPNGDGNYTGSRALRYRTNNNPGTGWGNWQTGGTEVNLDGVGNNVTRWSRVRQAAGGTYELFYVQPALQLNKATSADGINFTTVITNMNMIDFNVVVPTILSNRLSDFEVVDIGGEDWIYFTYCEAINALSRCTDTNIAVSQPVYTEIEVQKEAVDITGQVAPPRLAMDNDSNVDNSGSESDNPSTFFNLLPEASIRSIVGPGLGLLGGLIVGFTMWVVMRRRWG